MCECACVINIYNKMKQTVKRTPAITTNDMYAVCDVRSNEAVSYPLTRYEDIFVIMWRIIAGVRDADQSVSIASRIPAGRA